MHRSAYSTSTTAAVPINYRYACTYTVISTVDTYTVDLYYRPVGVKEEEEEEEEEEALSDTLIL